MRMPDGPMKTALRELATLIDQFTASDGVHATTIPRLFLMRVSHPNEEVHGVQVPAMCIVARGRKRVVAGQSIKIYDHSRYLIGSVELPVIAQVIEASPDGPYVGVRLDLDPTTIGGLMLDAKVRFRPGDTPGPAMSVS